MTNLNDKSNRIETVSSRMWERVALALNQEHISYCVLSGYESLHTEVLSDIDCVLDPGVSIREFVSAVEGVGFSLIQHLQHESTCHYLVFSQIQTLDFLRLDISTDYRRDGVVFYSAPEILSERKQYRSWFVPSARHEFGYYLVKKIAKGEMTAEHCRRLSALYNQDPSGCRIEIARFLAAPHSLLVELSAQTGDWSGVQFSIRELRDQVLSLRNSVPLWHNVRYWLSDIRRRVSRLALPTGVHVVLLGPDGSGKSTVMGMVETMLQEAFRSSVTYHLFPGMARRTSSTGPVVDPHALPPRSSGASIARMGYWAFEFYFGYWLIIRPKLVRSTLVLFDRYFLDILVDSKRYRYGGPQWLPRKMWGVLPKPDVIILLDASAEELTRRKHEVPLAEVRRQRDAYKELIDSLPNGDIVNAEQPIDAVVNDVSQHIIQFMAQRARRRLKM